METGLYSLFAEVFAQYFFFVLVGQPIWRWGCTKCIHFHLSHFRRCFNVYIFLLQIFHVANPRFPFSAHLPRREGLWLMFGLLQNWRLSTQASATNMLSMKLFLLYCECLQYKTRHELYICLLRLQLLFVSGWRRLVNAYELKAGMVCLQCKNCVTHTWALQRWASHDAALYKSMHFYIYLLLSSSWSKVGNTR